MSERTRILIVDDSQSFRKGMKALLEIQPDMQVSGLAPTGQKGIELIEALQPDLILLDAQMPGLSGMEVTREIKKKWPEIKVILMTMYVDFRVRAIEAGVDAFITKGVPPEQMLSVIRGISHQEAMIEKEQHNGL
jgi:DNA-binding NarL/FixJ family response regulator